MNSPKNKQNSAFCDIVDIGTKFPIIDVLWEKEPRDPFENMALDEVLLHFVERPLLRVYSWDAPTVSFGYFIPWEFIQANYHAEKWQFVRRWTGGGIVEHGSDLTYSLILPRHCSLVQLPISHSYRWIHTKIAKALQKFGLKAGLYGNMENKDASQHCFQKPVACDIMLDGKKIAGAAQKRTVKGLLHQGSLQGVPIDEKIVEIISKLLGSEIKQFAVSMEVEKEFHDLAKSKYATRDWTYFR